MRLDVARPVALATDPKPANRESTMKANNEGSHHDFLISALLFMGAAAAILVPLYLAYPPVPS